MAGLRRTPAPPGTTLVEPAYHTGMRRQLSFLGREPRPAPEPRLAPAPTSTHGLAVLEPPAVEEEPVEEAVEQPERRRFRVRLRRPSRKGLLQLAERFWRFPLAIAVGIFGLCGPAQALGRTDTVYYAVLVGLGLSGIAVFLGMVSIRYRPDEWRATAEEPSTVDALVPVPVPVPVRVFPPRWLALIDLGENVEGRVR